MKLKIIYFLALLISCSNYSQETKENNKSINEIGFELTGLVDSQYMLTYERSLNDHYSFLVGVGFKSEEGLVNLSGLDTPHIKTGDLNYISEKLSDGVTIFSDGLFYCYGTNGVMTLLEADETDCRVISSFKVQLGTDQHWSHTVIHEGRMYVRHGDALICYDISGFSESVPVLKLISPAFIKHMTLMSSPSS